MFKRQMNHFRRYILKECKINPIRYYSKKLSRDALAIDSEFIKRLERLSLVNFGSAQGVARLQAAITFAEQLRSIKLDDDIKPMYTVLENEILYLREDEVSDGGYPKKVLKNAVITEEGYFVAPPGNVPVNLTTGEY